MHDHAIARRHEVHDLAHRRSFLITSDHKSSRADLARITGLIKEGPDVAGLILVVQVSSVEPASRSRRQNPAPMPGAV